MIEIDGSYGEGGGQMMRTAVAMSLLTGRPFRMSNIRAGRRKPGLKAQHVHVLKAAMRLSGGAAAGATEGSAVVTFSPGRLRGATFDVDVGTAGSITLIMQTLLPALLFAEGRSVVTLRGGTDVSMSPTFEYFRRVVLPHAAPFAEAIEVDCTRRGFYPRGGGQVRVLARPRFTSAPFDELRAAIRSALPPIALVEPSELTECDVYSIASVALRPQRVAERQVEGAASALGPRPLRPHTEYVESFSVGTAATVVARLASGLVIGADALGERGKRAEDVGREAADRLAAELHAGAHVDVHLADHLVPWLALRGGAIRANTLSDHARTNCWLVEQFLGPTFTIDEASRTIRAT